MPVNSGTLAAIPGKNNVQISDIRVGGKMTLILLRDLSPTFRMTTRKTVLSWE